MQTRHFRTPALGGLDLHAQAWLAEESPRAVIVISHGLGEHSGRYARVALELVEHGYAVYAVDHRGHGRSPGMRANIERFDHVVSDFCTFAGRAAREHPGVPVFILGHSMGGAIALSCAARLQKSLGGLVLSAPALGLPEAPGALQATLARCLSVVAPNVGVLKLVPAHVSREPTVVRDYEADPLVHHSPIPARTVAELLCAMEDFPAVAHRLRLRTLVLHGTDDRLVPLEGAAGVVLAIDAQFRTVHHYPGLFHEVLNEPERDQVMGHMLEWLDSSLA
jgi:acylglycerol lipase